MIKCRAYDPVEMAPFSKRKTNWNASSKVATSGCVEETRACHTMTPCHAEPGGLSPHTYCMHLWRHISANYLSSQPHSKPIRQWRHTQQTRTPTRSESPHRQTLFWYLATGVHAGEGGQWSLDCCYDHCKFERHVSVFIFSAH